MPSTSPKQARLMAAVAHGWKPTKMKGGGPPESVAKEFNEADKGGSTLSKGMAEAARRRKKMKGGM